MDAIPRLATGSTEDEWAETAQILFHKHLYSDAIDCYERSSMPPERDVAAAYLLRQQATIASGQSRKDTFLKAANAFRIAGRSAEDKEEQHEYYSIAAVCFEEASDFKSAAEAYLCAEDYIHAAQCYRRAGLFDQAVDTIDKHESSIPLEISEPIKDVAKLYYVKQQNMG